MNARRLIALYPRKWRERYGEEICALVGDGPANVRDSADLIANCVREWARTLQLGRLFFPFAAGALANAIGWTLRDTVRVPSALDNFFGLSFFLLMAVWVFVGVRLAPSYWRWLRAPIHRAPPPFPQLSVREGRWVLAAAVIVGIVVPWATNLPREWWSFAANPSCSMLMPIYNLVWPLQPAPFESTVAFSRRPPKTPLGLA